MLDNTNTLRICDIYCFTTATVVTRTRLSVKLHVHYLSCLSGLLRLYTKQEIRKFAKTDLYFLYNSGFLVVLLNSQISICVFSPVITDKVETDYWFVLYLCTKLTDFTKYASRGKTFLSPYTRNALRQILLL